MKELVELYKQAFPDKIDGYQIHEWFSVFNLGICITEFDRHLFDSEKKLAKSILEDIIRKNGE